jgi:hypothetical protein
MMTELLRAFATRDEGAVTVDWVVLCAAVVGLGGLVLGPIAFGTDEMAAETGDYIAGVPVGRQQP